MLRNLPSFLIERRLPGERWRFLSLTFALTVFTWCCSLNHPGEAPSRGELYYPIAVTLPPAQKEASDSGVPPRYLFVANANFDLRYNAGSVQAFDLNAVEKEIASCNTKVEDCWTKIDDCLQEQKSKNCDEQECDDDEECLETCDKRCSDECDLYQACIIPPTKVLEDEVLIGSFAATAVFSPTGKRLYVPTRSNTSLTYIDVDPEASKDEVLSCGEGSGRKCGDDFVRGDEENASERRFELTGESVGAVAARLTELVDLIVLEKPEDTEKLEGIDGIFVAQRNGTVSFFISRDKATREEKAGPQLVHMIENFQQDITNIALDPISRRAYLTSQEYGTTVGKKSLQRVGFVYDGDPNTSFIYDAGFLFLRGVSAERDTRDVAFSLLAEDKAFVVSRTPNALLIVDFSSARPGALDAMVSRTVKVGSGASRLALGQIGSDIGSDPRLFAFVSCFGSRELYVIDVDLAEPVAVIQGFSGPFEVVVDRWRKLAYVADFRSSIIRIVDLAPIVCAPESSNVECPENPADATDPIPCECFNRPSRIVATLGEPRPPEELI